MKTPKQIYEDYKNGNPISDAELKQGMDFFLDLSQKLIQCGPVFSLAESEAWRIYMGLKSFQNARKEK